MIHVLHGNNIAAAYQRLSSLKKSYSNYLPTYIAAENSEDFGLHLASVDLFGTKKLLICENLLSQKKIKVDLLKFVPEEKILIIWEKLEIPPLQVAKLGKYATIENFKLPSPLFYFLDSIVKGSKKPFLFLKLLQKEKATGLTWHITNRLYLLILSKLNLKEAEVAEVSGSHLANWQWQKIKNQSAFFSLENLKTMFAASLKIDSILKTGASQVPESTLITLMLNKYLV